MRRMRAMAVGMGTAAAVAIVVACSDSGTGNSTRIDLTGSYTLVQLLLGGLLPAPGSTGTLTATSDSVHANIGIVSPDTALVHDTTLALAGSYLAKQAGGKDSIYIVITGLGTIPGTFTITGAAKDTLSLNLVVGVGQSFTAVWHKT
jgi:hypothetical protein